jgi:hypothetical protein
MADHAILVSSGGGWNVAREARFATERDLQDAVAAHPEVLPAEDIGLETLVTLSTAVAVAEGELDMLATDRHGRLAIVEFKKGPENTDVRKVVAQLLDYGSALWQMSVDELRRRCKLPNDLAAHVAEAYPEEEFDPEAFMSGLEGTLSNGDFVYLYVARVLDKRTRRVLTYLGDGVRLPFIAVEADHFLTGETAVLAPRPAFVPGWMIASGGSTRTRPASRSASEILESAPPPVKRLASALDELAAARSWQRQEKASFIYSMHGGPRLYFFPSFEGLGLRTDSYVAATSEEDGEELLRRIDQFEGRRVGRTEPGLSKPERLLEHWDQVTANILIPYVEGVKIRSS